MTTDDGVRRGYRDLLAVARARPVLAFGLIGRAPVSMMPVALVVAGEAVSGTYRLGGAASAGFSLAAAGVAPIAGRLVDRHGQRAVGRGLLAAFACAVGGLLLVLAGRAAPWVLVPLSAVAGASAPNIGAYARARWSDMVAHVDLRRAHALESVNDEVNFLIGPASATALAVAWGAGVPIAVAGLASAVGTIGLTAVPQGRGRGGLPVPAAGTPPRRWLTVERLWFLGGMVGLGVALSGTLVLIVAFTGSLGVPGGAALVLALNSSASLLGAIASGRLPASDRPLRALALTALAYSTLLWPLALVGTYPAFAVAGFVAGAGIAPLFIQANSYVAVTTAPGQATEAFSWVSAAVALGLAIGSAAAGSIVDLTGPDAARTWIVLLGAAPSVMTALGARAAARRRPDPTRS